MSKRNLNFWASMKPLQRYGVAIVLCSIGLLATVPEQASAQNGPQCSAAYLVDETLPNGARWEMCWERRDREGIVLHDIYYTTATGIRRKVLAQANVAQIHVPYDDNGARFHDVSDYGLGASSYLNDLTTADCLQGELIREGSKDVICKKIEPRGHAFSDDNTSLQSEALLLFSVSHVGAYNYIPEWRFFDDGTIEPSMGATGRLQRYGSDSQYGWPVRNETNSIGISHLHNYYWRLDFDIGENGTDETFEEIEFIAQNGNAQRVKNLNSFAAEASRSINPQTMRSWRVKDNTITNAAGRAVSYEIIALETGHRDTGPSFEPWTFNDIYVTKHRSCEKFISHNPSDSIGGCPSLGSVADFVNGESLTGADLVVWFGITFHHTPRDEDAAYMYAHWNRFQLVPRDWTDDNPLYIEDISNTAPTITNPGDQNSIEGTAVSLTINASDADGDTLSYSASGLPAGLSINSSSGVVSGTPTTVGSNNVTVTVSDGQESASTTLNWTIVEDTSNTAPTITNPGDQNSTEGTAVSLIINASDADGDSLSYSASGLPAGLSINSSSGVISGTPSTAGDYSVTVSVQDESNGLAEVTFNWFIEALVTTGPKLHQGRLDNVDNSWVTVTLPQSYTEMVVVASVQLQSGQLPAVPRIRNVSSNQFELRVQNPSEDSLSGYSVHYVVVESGAYTQAVHGIQMEAYRFVSSVTDRKSAWSGQVQTYTNSYTNPIVLGQVMTVNDPNWSVFWARGANRGASPSATTLRLGKHVGEDNSTNRADETLGYIVIEAGSGTLDGLNYEVGLSADQIQGVSNAPPYTVPLSFTATHAVVSVSGLDGGDGGWPVLWGVDPLASGQLDLAFDEDQWADNERSHTTEQVAYLVLQATTGSNTPPTITNPGDQNSTEGTAVSLTVNASDADGDTLSYSASGLPAGLSINSSSGVVSGTPTTVGSNNVTVTVSDGQESASTTLNWTIVEDTSNTAPTITNPGDQNSTEGTAVSLTVNASDADGDTLSYSASGLPAGLSINSSSGVVSGTPTTVGGNNVTITVSDGQESASTTFNWTIASNSTGPARILSPDPDSTLSGSSVTLTWENVGADQYWLYIGDNVGGTDYFSASQGLSTSATVNELPTDGSIIYVRLWTRNGSNWRFTDVQYTASSSGGGGSGNSQITSPTPGSTLPGGSITFRWSDVGADQYWLYIGSSVGGANYLSANQGLSTSTTVTGLPTDGRTVYVRLWTRRGSSWAFEDFQFSTRP